MFPQLPEEIEYIIWKFYYSNNVLFDIKRQECIWLRKDIKRLLKLCREDRCYEVHHSDIERMKHTNIWKMRFLMLTRYRGLASVSSTSSVYI